MKAFKILICLILVAFGFFVYLKEDDLALKNLHFDGTLNKQWNLPPPDESIKTILNQQFSYLDEGGYSIVFISEDQQYVLKFFKFRRFRPAKWVDLISWLPFSSDFSKNHAATRLKRLELTFNAHQIAYEKIKGESGLVFVQLNPSHEKLSVNIKDKRGNNKTIDLGEVTYIIQKKGTSLLSVISKEIKNDNIMAVKESIRQILGLYLEEYKKGILDLDHRVIHNRGFINEKPFHLDVGKVTFVQSKDFEWQETDLKRVTRRIYIWFQSKHPVYASEIQRDMDEFLSLHGMNKALTNK